MFLQCQQRDYLNSVQDRPWWTKSDVKRQRYLQIVGAILPTFGLDKQVCLQAAGFVTSFITDSLCWVGKSSVGATDNVIIAARQFDLC